jgi:hypothetical protein
MLTLKQYLRETNWKSIAYNQDLPDNVHKRRAELDAYADTTPMGHGANSFVYKADDEQQLNTVQRVSSIRKGDDEGYHAYAQFLIDNPKLKSNPYFPKIHAVDKYDDTEIAEYTIEHLYPFNSPKIGHEDMLMAVCRKMFTPKAVDEVKEMAEEDRDRYKHMDPSNHIFNAIARTISGCVAMDTRFTERNLATHIKDPKLAEAIRVISQVMASNRRAGKDMHAGNYMWRITGTMPQLVITDPLYQTGDVSGTASR